MAVMIPSSWHCSAKLYFDLWLLLTVSVRYHFFPVNCSFLSYKILSWPSWVIKMPLRAFCLQIVIGMFKNVWSHAKPNVHGQGIVHHITGTLESQEKNVSLWWEDWGLARQWKKCCGSTFPKAMCPLCSSAALSLSKTFPMTTVASFPRLHFIPVLTPQSVCYFMTLSHILSLLWLAPFKG